jgi:hypothetical protein
MPGGASSDPTLGTKSSVGKYFGVVSTIPSVLLVGWVYFLLAAGSLHHSPSLETLSANSPRAHPGYLLATVAAAIAVALIGHPLQFALVQLLEGYWGASEFTCKWRARLVMNHLRRIERASRLGDEGERRLGQVPNPPSGSINEYLSPAGLVRDPDVAEAIVLAQAQLDACAVINGRYPEERAATLPTQLGNVLRRHELLAGAAVHLPILDWATHIGMVASPAHTKYVNDQRTQLDLAVRTAASAFLAAIITFVLLWPYGEPVLLTVAPLGAAYLSYRGAVVCAEGYGRALRAWVDLNRVRLYSELGLSPVTTAEEEREQNDRLEDLALGQDSFQATLSQGSGAAPAQ